MAGGKRAKLTSRARDRSASQPAPLPPRSLVYTAQDLARFCEVDLKTIHHWADRGKIAHHRTSGRHLRFRRNHVLEFLRRHAYPIHAALASARPTVFFAAHAADATADDVVKKLGARFTVRRFGDGIEAIAHLVAGEPDALVLSAGDPTWNGTEAIRALKASAQTSWTMLAVVTPPDDDAIAAAARDAGADLVIAVTDLGRLSAELSGMLGVD